MTGEPSFYLRRISSRMESDVSSVLRGIDRRLAPPRATNPVLGEIPDMASLVQRAQREGVPIWKCSGSDQRTKAAAEESFASMAARVVEASQALARDGNWCSGARQDAAQVDEGTQRPDDAPLHSTGSMEDERPRWPR